MTQHTRRFNLTAVTAVTAVIACAVMAMATSAARGDDAAVTIPRVERDGYELRFDTLRMQASYQADKAGVHSSSVTLRGRLVPPGGVELAAYLLDIDQPENNARKAEPTDAVEAFEKRWQHGQAQRVEPDYRGRNDDGSQSYSATLWSQSRALPRELAARDGVLHLIEVVKHESVEVPLAESDAVYVLADGVTMRPKEVRVSSGYVSMQITDARRGEAELLSFGAPPFVWRHWLLDTSGAVMQLYHAGGHTSRNGSGQLYYNFNDDAGKPDAVRFDIATRVRERAMPVSLPKLPLLTDRPADKPAAAKPEPLPADSPELSLKLSGMIASTDLDLNSGRRTHALAISSRATLKDKAVIAIGRMVITHLIDDTGKAIAFESPESPGDPSYNKLSGSGGSDRSAPTAYISTQVTPDHLPQNIRTVAGYVSVLTAAKQKTVTEAVEQGKRLNTEAGTFDVKEVELKSNRLSVPLDFATVGSPMRIYEDRPFVLEYYVLDERDNRWDSQGHSGGWSSQQDGSATGKLTLRFAAKKDTKPKSINLVVVSDTKLTKLPFVIELGN